MVDHGSCGSDGSMGLEGRDSENGGMGNRKVHGNEVVWSCSGVKTTRITSQGAGYGYGSNRIEPNRRWTEYPLLEMHPCASERRVQGGSS